VKPESLIFFALMAGLLLLMFNRGRRSQRDAAATQARVAPGSKIMTTAGLYATVVEVDGDVVVLESAPGQRSRWDRRVVARIITDEPVAAPTDEAVSLDKAPKAPQAAPDGTAPTDRA
jgi:preprotein translocase subunit YajC